MRVYIYIYIYIQIYLRQRVADLSTRLDEVFRQERGLPELERGVQALG